MKYFCVNKHDKDYMGFGETPEDALADLIEDCGGMPFNDLDWYEMKSIKVGLTIGVETTIKTTTKKVTK